MDSHLKALSDRELIDYVIKHSTDPMAIRLATVMERMPGKLLDQLADLGMDDVFCTFNDSYSDGTRHLDDYVYHLRSEIDYLQRELEHMEFKLLQEQKELEQLKARTVGALIAELTQELHTADHRTRIAELQVRAAEQRAQLAKDQLKTWRILSNGPGVV
jgi:hypothetical protein